MIHAIRYCCLLRPSLFFMGLIMVLVSMNQSICHAAEPSNVDLPRFPSVSPDGRAMVFSWRGDLWKASTKGGQAIRLTSHIAGDLRSCWSPDGKQIAFNSMRSGYLNIHLMNSDGTHIQPVTKLDHSCVLSGFYRDTNGKPVIAMYGQLEHDVYRSFRPYTIKPTGGQPKRLFDAFGNAPVINPQKKQILFTRGSASWLRRHKRDVDTHDLWIYDQQTNSYTRLTKRPGNDGRPKWLNKNEILFLSDRKNKTVNLYRLKVGQPENKAKPLTHFKDTDVKNFDVSANGKVIVFTAWDQLYRIDLGFGVSKPKPLTIRAATDTQDQYRWINVERRITESQLSPDDKVMAYVAYGDVYIRHIDDNSPTLRVTRTPAHEKNIAWSPDGQTLYFVSNDDGTESIFTATVNLTRKDLDPHKDKPTIKPTTKKILKKNNNETDKDIKKASDQTEAKKDKNSSSESESKPKPESYTRWHDAIRFDIKPLILAKHDDRHPTPSPDGQWLTFRRNLGDLMLYQLDSGKTRKLQAGWDSGIHWIWSGDSQWIAFAQSDTNFNRDIWLVSIHGDAKPVNISRHPDNDMSPRFSADGKVLIFLSARHNSQYDTWRIYLDKSFDSMTKKQFSDYYKKAVDKAKKRKPLAVTKEEKSKESAKDTKVKTEKDQPNNIPNNKPKTPQAKPLDLEDAYLRVKRLTSHPTSDSHLAITPAGDRIIYRNNKVLYAMKWDGTNRKRLAGNASPQHLTITGDKVIVIEGGRTGSISVDGGTIKWIDIKDKIKVDLAEQASRRFLEAAHILGRRFYDPNMKGLDWPKLTERYHQLAKKAITTSEFDEIANRFLGELNASHLGIRSPSKRTPTILPLGYLGTLHHRVKNGYQIIHIVPESPADRSQSKLQINDIITAVNFKTIGPSDTVETLLENRVNKETVITIERKNNKEQTAKIKLLITPVASATIKILRYKAWVSNNAKQVSQWSQGRIGYLHIPTMNETSLELFERDLYAAASGRDGLIIDVRNNGGGWTTDRLLSSITYQRHAYTVPRGADPNQTNTYPQDRLYIQRYTLPINAMCNERSFSNAEIFAHAFKTLKRGTLVGQPTNGGVISTGKATLLDGTTVRIPLRGWYLPNGTDMENNPAVPDLLVPITPKDEANNRNPQLRAAVKNLLERLPQRNKSVIN